jgi:hypothetical protein
MVIWAHVRPRGEGKAAVQPHSRGAWPVLTILVSVAPQLARGPERHHQGTLPAHTVRAHKGGQATQCSVPPSVGPVKPHLWRAQRPSSGYAPAQPQGTTSTHVRSIKPMCCRHTPSCHLSDAGPASARQQPADMAAVPQRCVSGFAPPTRNQPSPLSSRPLHYTWLPDTYGPVRGGSPSLPINHQRYHDRSSPHQGF